MAGVVDNKAALTLVEEDTAVGTHHSRAVEEVAGNPLPESWSLETFRVRSETGKLQHNFHCLYMINRVGWDIGSTVHDTLR